MARSGKEQFLMGVWIFDAARARALVSLSPGFHRNN